MPAAAERYRFARFELDAGAEQLSHDGTPLHLTPKAFAVLLHLVRARGALVTREALFDAHWQGMVVGSDALTRCMVELRRVLDDDPKSPRFVATVHRRGFRFVGILMELADPGAPIADVLQAPAAAGGAPRLEVAGSTPLLGRAAEIAAASAAIDAPRAGQGHVLCLHGEPGIGKTRLLAAIEVQAAAAGFAVRSMHARDAATLIDVERPRAIDGWDATGERNRFLDARARMVLDDARATPLLLSCDDLEEAGADLLSLLLRLADGCARAPLLLVLAWRDVGKPVNADFDAALAAFPRIRAPRVDLQLRGLPDDDAMRLGAEAGAELHADEIARTGGNPLFVCELARLLARTPASSRPRTMPDGLRPVLRARLALLPAPTRTVLEVAAAIGLQGQRLLLESVAMQVSALATAAFDDALAEAVRERLLTLDARGDWRFAHAMLRDSLYEALLPGARARLHSTIGHTLERLVAGANEPPLAALAAHYERGLPEDIPRAIDFGYRAGVHALHAGACTEASALLDHAIERASARSDGDAAMLCEMLAAAAYAHALCGRPQRARALAQRAVRSAREARGAASTQNPEVQSAAGDRLVRALRLCCDLEPSYPQQPAIIAWLDEALALTERVSPTGRDGASNAGDAIRAGLLARRSFQAYLHGDSDAHDRIATAAVALARTAGDAHALDDALTSRAYALTHPRHAHALRALLDERMGLARTLGDHHREFDVRRQRLAQALEVGPQAAVRAEYERLAALGTLLDTPSTRATLLRARAGFAIAEGRLDDAWQLAQDAVDEGQHATDTGTVSAIAILQFGAILGLRDDVGKVQPELRDSPGTPNSLVKAAMIYLAAHHGSADYARWQLRELAASDFAALPRDVTWGIALSNLALSCEILGDTEVAAQLYPLLEPWAGRSLTALCYYNAGCGARFLGLLDALLGRHAQAADRFETALAVDARMAAAAWRVHTAIDYARTLLPHLPSAEQARVTAMLRAARDDAERLGLTVPQRTAERLLAG